jgi:hypothetical protein
MTVLTQNFDARNCDARNLDARNLDASAILGSGGRERRRSPRHSCNEFAEVMVAQPECLFRGEIRNISQNGCFVVTRARVHFERLTAAEIRFKLNNSPFRIGVRVMSARRGDGLGLEYVDLDPRSDERLRVLIQDLPQNYA